MSKVDKIADVLESLPDEMSDQEFEAMLCAIVAGYVGENEVPDYFQYLSDKVRMLYTFVMMEADEEMKH